jgi:CheY-like chemotaxis protein
MGEQMNMTRILLVDDNVMVAKLVAMRLEETGRYTVRIENRPGSAQSANREFQPHLWLFDVDMPGITGPELAKKLRKEPGCSVIPTIFLTSLVSVGETGEVELVSNGNRYLAKAAPIDVIGRCIDRALRQPAAA